MPHDPRGRRETGPGGGSAPGPVFVPPADDQLSPQPSSPEPALPEPSSPRFGPRAGSPIVGPAGPPIVGPDGTAAPGPDGVPLPPHLAEAARAVFGDRLPLAVAYAELLATEGVLRGLIGPREAPRIWDRHLLNCAVIAELIPSEQVVIDVGSGAGLPGVVLAIARPDLSLGLVEPLARRAEFLTEVVATLGLEGTVAVRRARAEELTTTLVVGDRPADVVTARAVAPLDRLSGWCLPLAAVGGRLLAMKGSSAAAEVTEHRDRIGRLGGGAPVIRQCGVELLDPPTTVVEIVRERDIAGGRSGSRSAATRAGTTRAGTQHSTAGREGRRTGRRDSRKRRGPG